MSERPSVYRKHQSFVGLKVKKEHPEAAARLEKLLESLPATASGRDGVVRQACAEALGKAEIPEGVVPFELHANTVEEIAVLTDAELPRYLHYRFRYETAPARRTLDAYPPCVQVEPTSVCNYRCVFCYQTDSVFTAKANGHMGKMDLAMFKRAIDELEGNVEAVTLASRGEPLIASDIGAMLDYMRGKFLASKMNTNAWFLDEKKCHMILAAELGTLVFSADAAAEPAYSQLRVGGNLERVLANVKLFQDIRAKHYPKTRLITRVSGVKFPGSGELEDMEKVWGDFVDQVAFVEYNPWENVYDKPPVTVDEPCSDLWRRLFLWWDGRANPCDVDYRSELSVGRFPEVPLKELWSSSGYAGLRKAHAERRRGDVSPCRQCTFV